MSSISFTLIDENEKRVVPEVHLSTLDVIVDVLSHNPTTIAEFEGFYKSSAGKPLYDPGKRTSRRLVELLMKQSGVSEAKAKDMLKTSGAEDKDPNYESYKPDEETPYDIPGAVGKGLNLRDALKDIDAGVVVVDLRTKEVRYLSEEFDITRDPGQYSLPQGWTIKSYSVELKETEH